MDSLRKKLEKKPPHETMNQSCFVAKIHAVGDSEANF